MRCPACDHPNPPGADECERCQTPLAAIDVPTPHGPIETSLLSDPVSVLDPRPPVTISEQAELGEAIRAMIDQRVGALLVTGPSGELVGILTGARFSYEGGRPDSLRRAASGRFHDTFAGNGSPHRHPGRGAGEDGFGWIPSFARCFRRNASWCDFRPGCTSSTHGGQSRRVTGDWWVRRANWGMVFSGRTG